MKKAFILFPTSLFKVEYFPKELLMNDKGKQRGEEISFYLVEDPVFFGYREKKMNFNQIKLVLHRASMRYYYDYLRKKLSGIAKVKYIEFEKAKKGEVIDRESGFTVIHLFDPVDHLLLEKVKKMANQYQVQLKIHPTPNFITPLEDLEQYAKGKKKYFHYHFYEWQKKRMGMLDGIKSKDDENRQPPPREGIRIPDLPDNPDLKLAYVAQAKKYVKKFFGNNYGKVEDFIYPITHQTSEEWFIHFLEHRFQHFGKYQDAIIPDEPFMFHSVISPMLNIGLLNPQWIVKQVTKYYQAKKIPVNNYEGFIRQIIGWREYSRFLYMIVYKQIKNGNYFQNHKKLNKKWYMGTTGIRPVDETIKRAFKYGYLHHILRLMVMGNFMNLCHLHPDQVYQWFMEFSCDSYDWVMVNNVYSMALYADGGLTMQKPYLSSSNYILKMSNYQKDGHWEEIWNALYYYFLYDKENEIKKTQMARNLVIWSKKSTIEKKKIKESANKIIRELTENSLTPIDKMH